MEVKTLTTRVAIVSATLTLAVTYCVKLAKKYFYQIRSTIFLNYSII